MNQLKHLKKLYDILANDKIRAACLEISEKVGIKKDIIRMDTNNLCNIECIMCNHKIERPTASSKEQNIMSFENYQKTFDFFAKNCRMLYLSCGHEPLMTPHFERYLSYAKAKHVPFVSLCTNAMLLNEKIIKCLVDEKINEIIISFNGYNERDYNRIMKKSNYEVVVNNIRKLSDYKKLKNSQYPKIRINSLLMKSNVMSFDKLIEFIHKYDADKLQIRELSLYGDQNDIEEVKLELTSNINSDELNDIFAKLRKNVNDLRNEGKTIIIPQMLLKNQYKDRKSIIKKSNCSIPYFSYWIEHDGMIRICSYDKQSYIGNVFKDDLKTINKNRDIYRKRALSGKCDSRNCVQNIDSSDVL